MAERSSAYRFLVGNSKGQNHKEDLNVDGKIILNWMLEKDWGMWTGFIWPRIDTNVGSFEHGNESSGYIKYWEYLTPLRNYSILKKGSLPWSYLSKDDASSSKCTERRMIGYVNNLRGCLRSCPYNS
jgi:hypothetical protein